MPLELGRSSQIVKGSTPKNDFCRILSRNSVLDPLSLVLSRVLDEGGEGGEFAQIVEGRIANIFYIFSQAENHVKEMVAERTVLHSKDDTTFILSRSFRSLTFFFSSFRSTKGIEAHDSCPPDNHAEVHQESVYAFDNS